MMNYSKSEVEISVIVPVYNIVAKNLQSTVDSIIKQSFSKFELIIVDDGSNDDCKRQCDEICQYDSRIKVIHKTNGGVSSARNTGINNSVGKYIAFIDAEDVVDRNYLESLYNVLKESEADVAICGCQFISNSNLYKECNNKYDSNVANNVSAILDLCYMNHPYKCIEVTSVWGSLFRKTSIGDIRFNERMVIGEDFYFKFKVYKTISTVVYLNAPMYGYVVSCTSAIHNKFTDKHYATFKEFQKFLDEFDDNQKIKSALQCRVVNLDILFLLRIEKKDIRLAEIENHIKENRKAVLLNCEARSKVKFALLLSIIGFDFMSKMFTLYNKMIKKVD